MIRMVFCVIKRADVPVDEFRRYWSGEHRQQLSLCAQLLKATRCTTSLTLVVERTERIMERRGTAPPFDAMIELWWPNASEFESLIDTSEVQGEIDKFMDKQSRYVDHQRSSICITDEPTTI